MLTVQYLLIVIWFVVGVLLLQESRIDCAPRAYNRLGRLFVAGLVVMIVAMYRP